MKELDLIIFGATGYTGEYVIEEVANINDEHLKWGIAGRNKQKLENSLKKVSEFVGKDLNDARIIIADIDNDESLKLMCEQCKVLINCVGPYIHYGNKVVKSCIESSTNYVDISGEPHFLELCQLNYHELAKEKHVYIIGSCGFDSIPCDLGCVFLEDNFKGDVNAIESYVELINEEKRSGSSIHVGTWESAIQGLADADKLKAIRKQLFTKSQPASLFKIKKRFPLHYSHNVHGWCLPFPGSDRSVVRRTQYNRFVNDQKRPCQIATYIQFRSFINALLVAIVAIMFGLFAKFNFGRYLLKKFPQFFSFGKVSKEGPQRKELHKTSFMFSLFGEGWSEHIDNPEEQHNSKPNKKVIVEILGPEPGYIATSAMLVGSALMVLKENDKIPGNGGVLTPGYAFSDTSLLSHLEKRKITFKIKSEIMLDHANTIKED